MVLPNRDNTDVIGHIAARAVFVRGNREVHARERVRCNRAVHEINELELLLIEAERKHVYALACGGQLKDDARRRIENELDLREAQLMRTTPRSGNDDFG